MTDYALKNISVEFFSLLVMNYLINKKFEFFRCVNKVELFGTLLINVAK